MNQLRFLLLPVLFIIAATAADAPASNPLALAMAGGLQAWEHRDLIWFINDVGEVPGAYHYVWRLRDALLAARPELDFKFEVSGVGDGRGIAEFAEGMAVREPALVVLGLGNVPAIGSPENAFPAEQFGKALQNALATLKAAHAEVVVFGPTPVSDTPEARTPADELSAKYAEVAAATARAADVAYVDMRAACLDYLKANPPAAGKSVLTAGELRFTSAWHELAAGLVAKAIGERMSAAPMRIDIADSPFIDSLVVDLPLKRVRKGADIELRYTLDGKEPGKTGKKYDKPFTISNSPTTLMVTATDKANNLTSTAKALFTKVKSRSGETISRRGLGLEWSLFQGRWEGLPDFTSLKPDATGTWPAPECDAFHQSASYGTVRDNVGLRFVGYIDIPVEGVYRFSTISDDGSRMWIDEEMVADNDGFHGMRERGSKVALREGLHKVRIDWFNGGGGYGLEVWWQSESIRRSRVPDSAWYRNLGKPHDWKVVEKPADKADKKK